jgi:hypothetical protein
MCYTKFDTIIVYIINLISCILLLYSNKKVSSNSDHKIIALFLLFVGQMQIFDYIFWTNPECNSMNKIGTKLAIIFNHLQPIVFLYLQKMYGYPESFITQWMKRMYITIIVVYSIFALYQVECTGRSKKTNIVAWDWNYLPGYQFVYLLFVGFLIVLSTQFKTKFYRLISAIVILTTFITGYLKPILNESAGRAWCYYAAFTPLIIFILDMIGRRYVPHYFNPDEN